MIKLKNNYKTCKIKKFLRSLQISHRTITKMSKELGIMKINQKSVTMNDIIHKNEMLEVNLKPSKSCNIPLCKKPLNIIFEDDYILIVDKPINTPTIPSFNHENSLAGMVQNYLGNQSTFRALNRLDANTTGVVIIAKDVITENILTKKGNIKKWYLAKVMGKTMYKGSIDLPIQDDSNLKKRVVSKTGLPAKTYYKRKSFKDNVSLIECHLVHGRTNQIRCHMEYIGHPLQNDFKYNENCKDKNAIYYLRCYKIKFKHPYTNKTIKIKLNV